MTTLPRHIVQLDRATQHLVRSTVVIRDLPHGVHALVQNALDAGATHVRVRVDCAGACFDVSDDGHGIPAEADFALLAQRHCTSRPRDRRGESLASLADVSRLSIASGTRRKTIRFGQPTPLTTLNLLEQQQQQGFTTVVTVREFFGCVPVRQRRLVASAAAEQEKTKHVVQELAIAHPHVAFVLLATTGLVSTDAAGQQLVNVPVAASVVDRFAALFGSQVGEHLRPVRYVPPPNDEQDAAVTVEGVVAVQGHVSKRLQFVVLNGRVVKPAGDPLLKAISAVFAASQLARVVADEGDVDFDRDWRRTGVYRKKTTQDRFGVFVLFLECDEAVVDVVDDGVYVIPQFHDWEKVWSVIDHVLSEFLRDANLLPDEAPAHPLVRTSNVHGAPPVDCDDDDYDDDGECGWNNEEESRTIEDHEEADDDEARLDNVDPPSSQERFAAHMAAFEAPSSLPLEDANGPTSRNDEIKAAFVTTLTEPPPEDDEASPMGHTDQVFNRYLTAMNELPSSSPTKVYSSPTRSPAAAPRSRDLQHLQQHLASSPAASSGTHEPKDSARHQDDDDEDHGSNCGEPTDLIRSATVAVNGGSGGNKEERNVGDLLAQWVNPVFPSVEDDVPRLPQGSHHRYAKYYRMGQSGMESVLNKGDLQRCILMGQIDSKFIACRLDTRKDIVLLIDQHAADERVRLERLTRQFTQALAAGDLVAVGQPGGIQVRLCAADVQLVQLYERQFRAWGVHFAFHRVADPDPPLVFVRQLPALVAEKVDRAPGILHNLISEYLAVLYESQGSSMAMPKIVTHLLNSKACRGAIKFGDPLLRDECQQLLDSLALCDFPFQCAHGRPSMFPLVVVPALASAPDLSSRDPFHGRIKSLKRLRDER